MMGFNLNSDKLYEVFMMKKLTTALVTNVLLTLLTSCASLSNTLPTPLDKVVDITTAFNPKNSSGKAKKAKTTVVSNSGKHKHESENWQTKLNDFGKKDIADAVEVTTAAVASLAVIGGKLAQYFTQQDKKNAVTVLKNSQKTQPVAWCSDSKQVSENIDNLKCGKLHKIVQTAGIMTKKEDKVCRSLKTEVITDSGEIQTETQHLCQAEDGEWYDKKTA
jgi:hypothetical protein